MHLFPIILTLLSTNVIVTIQHLFNFHSIKPRSSKLPKSIFITPLLEPCDRGYVQDDGKCLRLIRIDEPRATLLNRLQNALAGHEKNKRRLEQKLNEKSKEQSEDQSPKVSQDSREKEKAEVVHQKKDEAKGLLKEGQVEQPELHEASKMVEEWEASEEEQKGCKQVEKQEGHLMQSEVGIGKRYQYFVQNISNEDFDFVSFQERTTNTSASAATTTPRNGLLSINIKV